MSDELNPYPGNLKHHKVEPLLSDDDIMQSDSRSPAYEVRDIYEAARAKDAELIQKLVGALQDAVDAWDDGDLDTAIIRRLRTVLREAAEETIQH